MSSTLLLPNTLVFLNEDYVATQQRIDQEIAQLEARIVALKVTRNSFTPFARLHPEIVHQIFGFTSQGLYGHKIGKAALLVSWVCHNWRELALKTTELWNNIASVDTSYVEAALSRSGNRGLDIDLTFPRDYKGNPDDLIALFQRHFSRVKALSVLNSDLSRPRKLVSRFHPVWITPAPLLVNLDLANATLPSHLFAGTCPALRILRLSSCQFDWESLPLHTELRDLDISDPLSRVSVDNFMPKLGVFGQSVEILRLENVFLPIDPVEGDYTPQTREELSKIRSFSLDEKSGDSTAFFLDQLALPSQMGSTSIDIWDSDHQVEALQALISCRGVEEWPVTSLDIELQDEYMRLGIKEMWDVDDEDAEEDEGDEEQEYSSHITSLSILLGLDDDLLDVLPSFDVLPLLPFETLSFSGSDNPDGSATLMNRIDARGAIREIRVISFFIPTFTSIIYKQNQQFRRRIGMDQDRYLTIDEEIDEDTKEELRNQMMFRQLETLTYYGESLDDYVCPSVYYDFLAEWLTWRALVGLKVESLTFDSLMLPPQAEFQEFFEGIVGTFECVDVEQWEDESKVQPVEINGNA